MKNKWLIYVGVVLLICGIVLKSATNLKFLSLFFLFSGVSLKLSYITIKAVKKEYKIGWEIFLLILGLIIFGISLYLKHNPCCLNYLVPMIIGISLKVGFIVTFIIKTKNN